MSKLQWQVFSMPPGQKPETGNKFFGKQELSV